MMKKLKTIAFAFTLIFVFSSLQASSSIEGQWKNSKVSVLVEKTNRGIRVKRTDRNNWFEYEATREDQFRDEKGNTYILRRDGNLEWESSDGRRRIVFQRLSNQYQDSNVNKTTHIERNHYYGKDWFRSLAGKWINQSTGQSIWVKERRRAIRVKARRGGWVTFKPRSNRSFVDRDGNIYQFRNGRLSYTSYSGDFYMRFIKY